MIKQLNDTIIPYTRNYLIPNGAKTAKCLIRFEIHDY